MAQQKRPNGINSLHWRLEFALEEDDREELGPPEEPRPAKDTTAGASKNKEGTPKAEAQAGEPSTRQDSGSATSESDHWKTLLQVAAGICLVIDLWA